LKHDGKIPYETIAMPSELPYLHQIVNETLRMYAIIPFLDRVCEERDGYSLQPFSDFKIPYGMPVLIPIYPLGYDEKYFTEPWKFNPDRFEDTSSIPSCAHIPFGTGPRSCIGERLGLIEVKMAIVKILREFRVEMNEKTPREVKLMKEAIVISPDKPLIVDFVKDPLEI
jgi:cytochrome P450